MQIRVSAPGVDVERLFEHLMGSVTADACRGVREVPADATGGARREQSTGQAGPREDTFPGRVI